MPRALSRDEYSFKAERDHAADDAPCKCGSCAASWRYEQLAPIGDCSLTPGDASPAGRCADPGCDSLAYLDRPVDRAVDLVRGLYDSAGNLKLLPGDGPNAPPPGFASDDTHGMYTRAAWTDAVGAGDTRGYWEWVKMKIEDARQIAEQFGVVEPHTDPEDPTAPALKCGSCGEVGAGDGESTHQQWRCGACGAWNDKVEAAADRIHTGEFSKTIMAGYTVTGYPAENGRPAYWVACPPDGCALDTFPTEQAAWEGADNHRMFGGWLPKGYSIRDARMSDYPGPFYVVAPDGTEVAKRETDGAAILAARSHAEGRPIDFEVMNSGAATIA